MTFSLVVCRTGASTVNGGLTRDSTIAGHLTFSTTESLCQTPVRHAGSFGYAYVVVSANSTTADSTFKLRLNGADTTLAVTLTFGTTGTFINTSNFPSVANTDLASYRLVTGASGSITLRDVSIEFRPNPIAAVEQCVTLMVARGLVSSTADNASNYMLPSGYIDALNTTESQRTFRIRTPGTARNFSVNISSNLRLLSSTTFRTRVNAGNGGQSYAVPANTTGFFEDTSGSDALVIGDDFNYQMVTGIGTSPGNIETITVAFISTEFTSTIHEFILLAGHGNGLGINAGAHYYVTPAGRAFGESVEDQAELGSGGTTYCDFNFRVKDLAIFITTNTLSDTTDAIFLRCNNVSIPKLRITASVTTGLQIISGVLAAYVGGNVPFSYEVDLGTVGSGTLGLAYMSCVVCVHKAPILQRHSTQRALVATR